MPVRYGIVCDACRTLHFALGPAKPGRVRYDKARQEFKVACVPPCPNVIYFTKSMLMPYVVPDETIERGHAEIDECQPVARRG